MRLKLTVKRYKLPSVDLLWAVSNDKSKKAFTVAALLEEINTVIPLETEDWGLDDYAVELGDFEALHFQNVTSIFGNDDHITIRPLLTVDRRARYITGRDQINANGQHLFDGLPFGKPNFRRPDRPPVKIPAPKHPLLFEPGPGLLEGPQREEHSSDDDDDESFSKQLPPSKRRRLTSKQSDRNVRFANEGNVDDERALIALPSDAETEDEFQPKKGAEEESDSSSDSSSDTSSDSSSDTSSDDDDSVASKSKARALPTDAPSGESSSSSESSSDESSSDEGNPIVSQNTGSSSFPRNAFFENSDSGRFSDSDSIITDSDSDSEPEQASSRPNPFQLKADTLGIRNNAHKSSNRDSQKSSQNGEHGVSKPAVHSTNSHVPPGQGMSKTQARNRRRKELKKLKQLQEDGLLPPTATLASLREHQKYADVAFRSAEQGSYPSVKDALDWEAARQEDAEFSPRGMAALEALERNEFEYPINCKQSLPASSNDSKATEAVPSNSSKENQGQLEALRRKLLGDLETMDVDTPQESQPTSSTATSKTIDAAPGASTGSTGLKSRRARIDLASTRRHLFSALGVRAPRNKEEEDRLRESYKQASAPGKAKKPEPKPPVEEAEREEPVDPMSDAYKAKLKVAAFECTDPDNVEQISAPPYPFEQRWDPALLKYCDDDRLDRTGGARGKKRKRKNKSQDESYYYDAAEENDGMNYQEDTTENNVTLNYEEDEAAESQLLQEDQEAKETEDLPLPPSDLTTLKSLEKDDIVPGTVVVYQIMEFSAQTGWAPSMVQRTAEIIAGDDLAVQLRLAKRDRPEKEVQYDWRGKRLYDKFEMENDDEEDPDVVEYPLTELIDPKILRAAPQNVAPTASAEDAEAAEKGGTVEDDEAAEAASVNSSKKASEHECSDDSSVSSSESGGTSNGSKSSDDEEQGD